MFNSQFKSDMKFIKILLCFISILLSIFFICFVSTDFSTVVKDNNVDNIVPNESFTSKYPLSIDFESFSDKISEDLSSDNFVAAGAIAPDIDIKVIHNSNNFSDSTFNPSAFKGKFVIQIVADWCSFCQTELNFLDKTVSLNPDVVFVQYLSSGSVNEMSSFYKTANAELNDDVIVLEKNDLFDEWLSNNQVVNFPTTLFFSKNIVSFSTLGAINPDLFTSYASFAFTSPIYELTNSNGETILSILEKQKIAQDYVSQLTEIEVPQAFIDKYYLK